MHVSVNPETCMQAATLGAVMPPHMFSSAKLTTAPGTLLASTPGACGSLFAGGAPCSFAARANTASQHVRHTVLPGMQVWSQLIETGVLVCLRGPCYPSDKHTAGSPCHVTPSTHRGSHAPLPKCRQSADRSEPRQTRDDALDSHSLRSLPLTPVATHNTSMRHSDAPGTC